MNFKEAQQHKQSKEITEKVVLEEGESIFIVPAREEDLKAYLEEAWGHWVTLDDAVAIEYSKNGHFNLAILAHEESQVRSDLIHVNGNP
jgi:hypothetical protein